MAEAKQGSDQALVNSTTGHDTAMDDEANDVVYDDETLPLEEESGGYDTVDDEDSNQRGEDFEPDDTLVNSLKFSTACIKLEKIWQNKRKKRAVDRWKEQQRLEMILPKKMIEDLNGQTIYPWLRLLLPDQDSQRQFSMRDRKIAEAYCKAFGFPKGSKNYNMLFEFTDPEKVPPEVAGDLSLVVEHILKQRFRSDEYSKVTIGKMNELLDEAANLRAYSSRRKAHSNHQWRESQSEQALGQESNSTRVTDAELRANWLSRVIKRGLSPLEHKWLVRILLKKMEISLGYITILKWYSPYASELWQVMLTFR
mmetsp:Transcript_773/g.1418  ORF Transcript_773/g.1418 Transcript_773/m.1418 type:complete len:311 (+) Transcript_773:50-982(+)